MKFWPFRKVSEPSAPIKISRAAVLAAVQKGASGAYEAELRRQFQRYFPGAYISITVSVGVFDLEFAPLEPVKDRQVMWVD